MVKIAVVALGGNALVKKGQKGTFDHQYKNMQATAKHLVHMIKNGYEIVITHGNGFQIGELLLQQETSAKQIPEMPLDACGAMTQGLIGYMIQQTLQNQMKKFKVNRKVITLITQVVVDKKDKAFKKPTKPIGPYYDKKGKFKKMVKQEGKWRRVVASPKPLKIVERGQIQHLVEKEFIVIASGGGGIPVTDKNHILDGIEAVIDKDLAAQKLATQVNAELLVILTPVSNVYLNYGTKKQKALKILTQKQARKYLKRGQFPEGSMGPKIQAALKFLDNGGERVIITAPHLLDRALKRKAGTVIIGDSPQQRLS